MKKSLQRLKVVLFSIGFVVTGFSFAQTYTFTTGGQTGSTGPTQAMINAAYLGTNLDGNVTVTGGIQYWVVPTTGNYQIEAYGAQGYGAFGGRGAYISGEFFLTAGTTLKILVGQQAPPYLNYPSTTYNHQYGGGGGSFVTDNSNNPFVVAGGGGGNHANSYLPACDGQITTAGSAGAQGSTIGAGGTSGNGGLTASSADGGGGLLTNGTGAAGGFAFVNGGNGGFDEGFGGFGCGGGTSSWNNYRGGGGGGYSGGGGGNNGSTCCAAGGGGGSFNGGSNPNNLAGVQLGDGEVVITNLCVPTSLTPDVATLTTVTADCRVDSLTVPTATSSCGNTIMGTPDVTFPITATGSTTVTWTYFDGVNTVTQTQTVSISGNDVTAPVPDLGSLPSEAAMCAYSPTAAPTATDFCDGSIAGVPDVTFPITTQGNTVVTWTYTDGNGNSATQTQNITIMDIVEPVPDAASLPDESGCLSVMPSVIPTATDSCTGSVTGVPDVALPITTPGVTVITWAFDDGYGNVSYQQQSITVYAVDVSTTLTDTTLTANASGMTYQWIDCATNDPISGANGQSFTPTNSGSYAVIITDTICSDTSACVAVGFANLDEMDTQAIQLYPNPTSSGEFTVNYNGKMEDIVILDMQGRAIEVPVDTTTGRVDGATLVPGKYVVKVITSTAVFTKGLQITK